MAEANYAGRKFKSCSVFIPTIVLIFGFMITSCGDNGNGITRANVMNETGGSIAFGKVQVDFPPGAVDDQITIQGRIASDVTVPANITPLTEVHHITLSDHSQYNENMAMLKFVIDKNVEDASIYHSKDGVNWENLVGEGNGTEISHAVDSFSYFFVGRVPDSLPGKYTVNFINNTNSPTTITLFQTNDSNDPEVYSVAWLAKYANTYQKTQFSWNADDYEFMWAYTGRLQPGVICDASETSPADPNSSNLITLQHDSARRTTGLSKLRKGPQTGKFYIENDSGTPLASPYLESSGIAMSGSTAFVRQAIPDKTSIFNTEGTKYWFVYGKYEHGVVLDVNTLRRAPIVFPDNVFNMTITLNDNDTWSIALTP